MAKHRFLRIADNYRHLIIAPSAQWLQEYTKSTVASPAKQNDRACGNLRAISIPADLKNAAPALIGPYKASVLH
eukprot:scaffold266338_cov31-Prasinocladus_malaysianus.AAC.1